MSWYQGKTVLNYLETVEIKQVYGSTDFRYAVQYVLRPNLNYRGYAGQISSGRISKGDSITVYPSGKSSRVAAIDTYNGELESAHAPMSVTLRLEDEIDISRGDLITNSEAPPQIGQSFESMVVWMSETPLDPNRLIKEQTAMQR